MRAYVIQLGVVGDVQPISRPSRVSLKKTLIYRAVVDPVAVAVTYLLTGQFSNSILAVILIEAFSTAFYYALDRMM